MIHGSLQCRTCGVLLACVVISVTNLHLFAQNQNAKKQAKATAESWLPREPARWLNAPPITGEMVEGKAVFVWFFEDSSPRAAKRWPNLMKLAEKHARDPILFIATSGGNSREKMASYIANKSITWPIVVDPKRQFEQHIGKRATNPDNLIGLKLIMPDGSIVNGNPNKLEDSIQTALKDAEWEIASDLIVDEHLLAWRHIEFKNYSGAAGIQQDLKSRHATTRHSAEVLFDTVMDRLNGRCEEASQMRSENSPLDAYLAFSAIRQQFRGFEIPKKYAGMIKDLEADPDIRDEIRANEMLLETLPLISDTALRNHTQATSRLRNLIRRYPGTRAANEAKSLLKDNN